MIIKYCRFLIVFKMYRKNKAFCFLQKIQNNNKRIFGMILKRLVIIQIKKTYKKKSSLIPIKYKLTTNY